MKKLITIALLALAPLALAENCYIANDNSHPIPINAIAAVVNGTGTNENYYSTHLTANGTTPVTSSTAYISTLQITCTGAGTTETIKVQNKEGTPKVLYLSGTLVVGNVVTFSFDTGPVVMTGGIDIVYAGTTAGTVDVFITYSQ